MLDLNVQADVREVERMLSKTQRSIIPKATTSTLNKVAVSVQKEATKLIAKDIGLTQKEVRKHLNIYKASWRNLSSSITAKGTRIPLGKLGPRQLKRGGVTYKGRGGVRKKLPGAFVATMNSGHKGVYKRAGKKRLPIIERFGASIPHVFIQERIDKAMHIVAKQRWGKVWPHEVRFRLQKAGYS